ncbi:unnamed protein product [Arctia plantaginis]|uniref:HTH psq-type domain-containing protein n=1 Tax=Arctia plantaginis TaxID=874455 RepID=A0A8S0YX60_ARCPL|nr:unnamed protein product [Arctia plantaginis]
MKSAIEKVQSGEMGLNKAYAEFNVPKTNLKRTIKKYLTTQNIEEATEKNLGRFKQIFTKDQELELAAYVKDIESRFFGLTTET